MDLQRIMSETWPWIEAAHGMRSQLLDMLNDADLAFTPGGQNMTLGALCREMGENEYAYTQSLKTFKQDCSYRNDEAGLADSVARLKEWFQTLDDHIKTVINTFSEEDMQKPIERGGDGVSIAFQLEAYLQAVLIFLGKATIYLKAMNKALPQYLQEYIG